MKDQHLASCKEAFVQIAEKSLNICRTYEKYNPELKNIADIFEQNLKARLDNFNPQIMVYGIYNSGKSTIMNALMGEMRADMSDIPTTFKIDEYRWKEYTIYDTPGINAPKKDEEVSKAQLEKCDVILFVMDTEGAFNLGKNYYELIDIIRKGKRLLIVLNNKSGYDLTDPEDLKKLAVVEHHIYSDFSELYGKTTPEELAQKIKIITVNALDALRARTDESFSSEEKAILLENSNIFALENAIIAEYGRTSGFTILHQLEIQLTDTLQLLEEELKKISSDELGMQGKETLHDLQNLKEMITAKVIDYAKERAELLNDDIYRILTNVKDEKQAQADIEKASSDWAEGIQKFMAAEMQKNADRVETELNEFNNIVNINSGDISVPTMSDTAQVMSADTAQPISVSDSKNAMISVAQGYLIQKSAKAILPVITKLPWIGPVIGKILGPMVPIIGPIITIASIIIPFLGKSEEEKRFEEQMQQARLQAEAFQRQQEEIARRKQEIKEESSRICRKICAGVIDYVTEAIDCGFEPSLMMIQNTLAARKNEAADAVQTMREVNNLKSRLKEEVARFCNN